VDEWSGLRTVLVIVAWLTVAGGALMAILWIAFGGERAVGPEDEMMARAGVRKDHTGRPFTSFSSAQVGVHGLLGILTAALITYAAVRSDDRAAGYWAGLVAIAVTAVPGTLMFLKWRSRRRPVVAGASASARGPRVEDRLPSPVVLMHGAAVLATAGLLVALLLLD
jgi:hypothetical protein